MTETRLKKFKILKNNDRRKNEIISLSTSIQNTDGGGSRCDVHIWSLVAVSASALRRSVDVRARVILLRVTIIFSTFDKEDR